MDFNLKFANGVEVPRMALGTWQLKGESCTRAVETAIEIGYKHIDTADAYGNHRQVGEGIKNSGIERKDLFVTTKVWRDFLKQGEVASSVNRFLSELQINYIDLLLVHWPNKNVEIRETLGAFAQLKEKKIIRAIGVSNFTVELLKEAINTGVEIVNNQVEFHPSLNQKKLESFCNKNNIVISAYSPIAQGADLQLLVVKSLAEKYGRTPSQIILNWLMAKNKIVLPRSSNPERIKENFGALDFEMEKGDCDVIDNVGGHNRIVEPDFAPMWDEIG